MIGASGKRGPQNHKDMYNLSQSMKKTTEYPSWGVNTTQGLIPY